MTDAIEAALRAPGEYELGDRPVRVRDGAARLADGTLAGSVLTLDQAVRNLVASGATLEQAVRAAAAAPAACSAARTWGCSARAPAHLTVLDAELSVTRTLVGGAEAFPGCGLCNARMRH